jgi:hypothetical protein
MIFLTAIGFAFLMVIAGVVAAIGYAVYLLVWLDRYYS